MTIFSLLWMPFFYLFWSSLAPDSSSRNTGWGGICALVAGGLLAVFQFFYGPVIDARGFGLSRWLSAFIDIVSLPVLLPFLFYLLLLPLLRGGDLEASHFALLWLIPGEVIRTVSWSARHSVQLLILTPLLRAALVIGISCFIALMRRGRLLLIPPAVLGCGLLPFAAATSFWAFFSYRLPYAWLCLAITALPGLVFIGFRFYRAGTAKNF